MKTYCISVLFHRDFSIWNADPRGQHVPTLFTAFPISKQSIHSFCSVAWDTISNTTGHYAVCFPIILSLLLNYWSFLQLLTIAILETKKFGNILLFPIKIIHFLRILSLVDLCRVTLLHRLKSAAPSPHFESWQCSAVSEHVCCLW